jgi:dihydrodipicolinate synthase/N-acetylneuraminate lyase
VPLPLVLYNMPGLTKVSFEPDTVRQMLQYEKVIGIKDSSGDLDVAASYVKVVAERPDWTLMTGPEELLANAIKIGVLGGVCGGGNLFPRLFVDLYEAATAKDTAKTEVLHSVVLQLGKTLYGVGQYSTSYMKGIKCALSCLGICDDYMALPLNRFAEKERSVIKLRIEQLSELEAVGVQSVLASHTT